MQDQGTKPTKGKFLSKTKKKTKKRVITAVVLVALAAVLILPGVLGGGKEVPQLDLTDTTVLAYTDLRSTISATGTVESAESTTVYSTVAYPVMAVHVEVGDQVREGDLLAELDDHSIQNQITSQEISLDLSTRSSSQQVQAAQDNYNNFKSGIDQGLNATLNGAKNQVENAYNNYEKALTAYKRYRDSLDEGENTALLNAEAAYRSASEARDTARETYRQLSDGYDAAAEAYAEAEAQWNEANAQLDALKADLDAIGEEINRYTAELAELAGISEESRTEEQQARVQELNALLLDLQEEQNQLTASRLEQELQVYLLQTAYDEAASAMSQLESQLISAEKAVDQAEQAYDLQRASYRATVTTVDNTLADYQTNVDTAWDAYQDALTSLASTEKTVSEQLKTYENNLNTAQIGANKAAQEESLRQLKENLEDTRITAPVSGTVTAVYAKVGGSGSGLLFVIEDVDNLVVDTSVKGYDVGAVQPGMKVLIRSDATGDAELEGVLTSIAPTSNKNAMGQTDVTGEAVFAAEVEVTSKDTDLRIGMEAQLDYILAEASHVLAVPYDAVYKDETGQTCVLAALEQEDGHYLIQSLPVTTGMDDDLDMVITGPEIREGLRVIHDPDRYLELLGQSVLAGTGLHNDLMSAMMGG